MPAKLVAPGRIVRVSEKYIYTTDGQFNRKWYCLPINLQKNEKVWIAQ